MSGTDVIIPDFTVAPPAQAEPAMAFSYTLDIWQQYGVQAIHNEQHILVTAKTSSGKTTVGEYQIAFSLSKKKRVFYTTPIKSLTNQKYHDLKRQFPSHSVGIMTGDIKSNPEADIVVMTTEILRNLLFKQSTSTAHIGTAGALTLDNVDAVVFDEVHYINDPERGHVWEETMILLPPHVKMVLLSATIASAREFAAWLGRAKQRPVMLLQTTHRIVPLIHGLYDPSTPASALPLQVLKAGDEAPYQAAVYSQWLRAREQRAKAADDWQTRVKAAAAAGDSIAGAAGKVKLHSFTHTLNECVTELKTRDLLPALFFVMSRRDCERYADQITGSLIDSTETASVKHIIQFHLHKYADTLQSLRQYHQIVGLLERGIAFHHSGLLPLLKEIVELLFSRGFIKVLFCTETFAVGLNMPARTVVFLDMKKPADGGAHRIFRADEYIQMAGRAGRRGKDTRGVVLYLPARTPVEPDELRTVFSGSLVPLESRLSFHYDFVLKAIHASKTATVPLWDTLVDASFWTAQRKEAADALAVRVRTLRETRDAIPLSDAQRAALDERSVIEQRFKTSTNAARRKAQQELGCWDDAHMGPTWKTATMLYTTYMRQSAEIASAEAQLLEAQKPCTRIAPVMEALRMWGAFDAGASTSGAPVLTQFGTLATEINEGNSLLIAKLYESKAVSALRAIDIVGILGAFIVDREALEKSTHPRGLRLTIPDAVKEVLLTIDGWGQRGAEIDRVCGVESPETYWDLATLWVDIAYDWMDGTDAAVIAARYDIYEGNLMKGLHKLANLVNEWIAMATYTADVDMLEKLKDVPGTLLRDISVPESLYLHL